MQDHSKSHPADETFLTLNGDFLGGSWLFKATKGKAVIDCLKLMEVDYVCIGNHEFDYGLGSLEQNIRASIKEGTTWLNTNIEYLENGKRPDSESGGIPGGEGDALSSGEAESRPLLSKRNERNPTPPPRSRTCPCPPPAHPEDSASDISWGTVMVGKIQIQIQQVTFVLCTGGGLGYWCGIRV